MDALLILVVPDIQIMYNNIIISATKLNLYFVKMKHAESYT